MWDPISAWKHCICAAQPISCGCGEEAIMLSGRICQYLLFWVWGAPSSLQCMPTLSTILSAQAPKTTTPKKDTYISAASPVQTWYRGQSNQMFNSYPRSPFHCLSSLLWSLQPYWGLYIYCLLRLCCTAVFSYVPIAPYLLSFRDTLKPVAQQKYPFCHLLLQIINNIWCNRKN